MEKVIHRINPSDGELENLLNKTLTDYFRTGYIKLDGVVLPECYERIASAIENFEIRDDDVWVCSFPKTGTTWTQEMVWSIANDLDFDKGNVDIETRFPCIELSHIFDKEGIAGYNPEVKLPEMFEADSVTSVEKMPSPRFIKTHLPHNLLPRQLRNREKNPKIIYVTRNSKDTCISFYHHCKLVDGFRGSFDDFCKLFLGDMLYYGPFWSHVLSFWKNRFDFNMLFLKYEDMKKDLPAVIRRTANFLGKNLTDDQISLLNDHLSISSMRKNSSVNYEETISKIHKMLNVKRDGIFLRSGTTDQWKTVMKPEIVKQFDDRNDRYFSGTGIFL